MAQITKKMFIVLTFIILCSKFHNRALSKTSFHIYTCAEPKKIILTQLCFFQTKNSIKFMKINMFYLLLELVLVAECK